MHRVMHAGQMEQYQKDNANDEQPTHNDTECNDETATATTLAPTI